MTVQEWFEGDGITREAVDEWAEESEYSMKAATFIGQKWNTDADDLTAKQATWAGKILDDLVERRINNQQRNGPAGRKGTRGWMGGEYDR